MLEPQGQLYITHQALRLQYIFDIIARPKGVPCARHARKAARNLAEHPLAYSPGLRGAVAGPSADAGSSTLMATGTRAARTLRDCRRSLSHGTSARLMRYTEPPLAAWSISRSGPKTMLAPSRIKAETDTMLLGGESSALAISAI